MRIHRHPCRDGHDTDSERLAIGGRDRGALSRNGDRVELGRSTRVGNGANRLAAGLAERTRTRDATSQRPVSGVVLHLAAKNASWHPTELRAPAAKRFQLEIGNEDTAESHNFLVANGQEPTAVGRLFVSGPAFAGPATKTYDVPGLPAGRYVFWCAVHPNSMTGTIVVE